MSKGKLGCRIGAGLVFAVTGLVISLALQVLLMIRYFGVGEGPLEEHRVLPGGGMLLFCIVLYLSYQLGGGSLSSVEAESLWQAL
jgi:hypothetical protein